MASCFYYAKPFLFDIKEGQDDKFWNDIILGSERFQKVRKTSTRLRASYQRNKLPELKETKAIAQRRMSLAGYRLADVLNQLFGQR